MSVCRLLSWCRKIFCVLVKKGVWGTWRQEGADEGDRFWIILSWHLNVILLTEGFLMFILCPVVANPWCEIHSFHSINVQAFWLGLSYQVDFYFLSSRPEALLGFPRPLMRWRDTVLMRSCDVLQSGRGWMLQVGVSRSSGALCILKHQIYLEDSGWKCHT